MIKLAISGCAGKMGTRIFNLALDDKDLRPVIGIEQTEVLKQCLRTDEFRVSDNPDDIKEVDVLIEFTAPGPTIDHLDYALKHNKAMVIGTTGLSEDQIGRIREASKNIPIVFSPNMSIGVNLLFRLVKEAAEKLSKDYKIKILEAHHIHKKDAPSGTAKKLAQVIKEASGREVSDIKAIREGEIVGDHKVTFESPVDTIELSHSAKTRDIFAKGALAAAKFIAGKKPGLYDMQDVLGAIK
ncbi:MAG: 4-hydroxy-tetrahydrodipicolinate reductase [Candidatus Omnitrophota bacterium]|nr:4-hydroxy-tetrahydrodipicolinate reductase [Candidatus Omnitrophota bacterium]